MQRSLVRPTPPKNFIHDDESRKDEYSFHFYLFHVYMNVLIITTRSTLCNVSSHMRLFYCRLPSSFMHCLNPLGAEVWMIGCWLARIWWLTTKNGDALLTGCLKKIWKLISGMLLIPIFDETPCWWKSVFGVYVCNSSVLQLIANKFPNLKAEEPPTHTLTRHLKKFPYCVYFLRECVCIRVCSSFSLPSHIRSANRSKRKFYMRARKTNSFILLQSWRNLQSPQLLAASVLCCLLSSL